MSFIILLLKMFFTDNINFLEKMCMDFCFTIVKHYYLCTIYLLVLSWHMFRAYSGQDDI